MEYAKWKEAKKGPSVNRKKIVNVLKASRMQDILLLCASRIVNYYTIKNK